MTRKKFGILLLIVIIVPIIYNKTASLITGLITAQFMKMPKEVVAGYPQYKNDYVSAQATGRVEAIYSIDVMARVPGFLIKKYFKEGDFVKKGQTLFQIDPREYQIEVRDSQASVNQYRALLLNAQQELNRANSLIKEDLISHSQVDSSLASRNENQALLDAARQKLALAKVNLSYTTIKSPVDGRIGKINITEGNYVALSSGSLVNVSSVNPVYVTFSLRQSDFIKLLKSSNRLKDVKVKVQFDGGQWYKKYGTINSVDNQIDKNSGSIQLRATFDNPQGWLVPGNYMKVSLLSPKKFKYMTVPQACTKGDAMSGYYVWVIGKNNAVKRKDIKVSDEIDNNWIVESGLSSKDRIVVSGVQNISTEGQKVKPITQAEYKKKEAAKENKD
ncbi:MAG: efflux RND transporter periplasmic adaptor subunit [Cyanobacteriota bacterium]|nr:efflux RND transporter periplasmic adaptor subunit [Cyanobacteriota bacterium]